jgi:hypothetical protein
MWGSLGKLMMFVLFLPIDILVSTLISYVNGAYGP